MRSGESPDARLRPMVLMAIEKRAESPPYTAISARFFLRNRHFAIIHRDYRIE
jgi:hypothetical protein